MSDMFSDEELEELKYKGIRQKDFCGSIRMKLKYFRKLPEDAKFFVSELKKRIPDLRNRLIKFEVKEKNGWIELTAFEISCRPGPHQLQKEERV